MSVVQMNKNPCSRPSNIRAPFQNTGSKKCIVLCRGHVCIFENNVSTCQQNSFSLYEYLRAERPREMEEREGLWIIKIIPAENVTRQSRYFALSSDRDVHFWTDHCSKEIQMAEVHAFTQMINGELSMKCGIGPTNEKDKINNLYMHINGVSEETTTDTIHYFFENKKRSGVGNVYFVDRLRKKECIIFFMSDKVITEFPNKSFLIDNAKITVVEKGSSFSDRVLVQNVHRSTTKDGLKCFVKAQTGKDVQSIIFDKTGKAILEFGNVIDFTAVKQACEKETLDSNSLKIKPIKSSKKILVKGYENGSSDDLFFYFDNVRQSGGEDVEKVKKIDDETHLVEFMFSHCLSDVCKRRHSLKDKTLKVQMYYQCIDRSDENDFLTDRKEKTKLLKGQKHYNYDLSRSTDVTKNRKRRISDALQMSNSPTYHLPHISREYEKQWNLDSFISNTEIKKRKIKEGARLSRCIVILRNKKIRMKNASRAGFPIAIFRRKNSLKARQLDRTIFPTFHRASFTRRNRGRKKGKKTDINKISNSPIREDPASVNSEAKTTLLHTSKAASEENKNLQQDYNVPTFHRASFTRRNRGRKKGKKTGLVKSLSKAEENFLVFYNLCVLEARLPVQRYFSRKVPESTLAAHLESYFNDLKFSRWKCKNEQLDLLFPAVSGTVCSTSFDFSLLYKLIRNTLPLLSSPTRGWGSKPLPGDITELDDVERIRYYRTLLANNTEFMLKNSEFKHLMTDLSQAITRLSFGKLTVDICCFKKILNQSVHKEMTENIRMDIEKIKDEMNTLHRDMFEGKDRVFKLQERLQEKTDQLIAFCGLKTESDSCAPYIPVLKEHLTFDITLGAKKREVRDCTIIPGGGWIVSDYNNSELIINGLCIRIKLSKPTFVTCIDGNIAVACASEKKIRFFDINTLEIKKEIQTVETVFGMTNTRAGLLVRAGNAGCRFISSGQSDEIIPINGDNMLYIAVWEDNIFLTNWKSHEINCYNTCGVLQWSFTNENMRSPNGVSTDKEGNVFVVGTYSHNILILSKNYKETNTYWFEDAGMRYPIAIDYDHIRDKLVVCNMKGTVKVFDVAPAVT